MVHLIAGAQREFDASDAGSALQPLQRIEGAERVCLEHNPHVCVCHFASLLHKLCKFLQKLNCNFSNRYLLIQHFILSRLANKGQEKQTESTTGV